MRKSLIGYYTPSEAEFKELWDKGLIVLDTSVLLNLYRYSPASRDELLKLLEKLKKRLWIPHRVAWEYHENRLNVIRGERKTYDDFLTRCDELITVLEQSRRHPFVSDKVQKRFKKVIKDLRKETQKSTKELDGWFEKDPILERVTAIYEGRVGKEPTLEVKEAWKKIGEDRFRRRVPPGFEDLKKADDRKFGDLLLWMELLEHLKGKKTPVIFVTGDIKSDWWRIEAGERIGPHPALIGEVVGLTSMPFHIYRPERFVEFAGKHLSQPVSSTAVSEIKKTQPTLGQWELDVNRPFGTIPEGFLQQLGRTNQLNLLEVLRGLIVDHSHPMPSLDAGNMKLTSVAKSPSADAAPALSWTTTGLNGPSANEASSSSPSA